MRINKIILNNIGSYEGTNEFDFQVNGDRNIVLIGGKNGAGKTTLFTAIRICLYGHMSMGYRNQNSYYFRAISKLINNTAKLTRPATAYVRLDLAINNGQGLDQYTLLREWKLDDTLTEHFWVYKNERALSINEVADFEKYLLTLLPPELFNLYFFDGERIADFFLTDGSNTRIKDAFLTLCGYDTFDIMKRQFRRANSEAKKTNPEVDAYLSAKEKYDELVREYAEHKTSLAHCIDTIASIEADIVTLDKEYSQKGGITQEEWASKLALLKEEEKKRDNWNALLKKWANDIIPFIMIRERVEELEAQIHREHSSNQYKSFCELVDLPEVQYLLSGKKKELKEIVRKKVGGTTDNIVELSLTQSASILAQIKAIKGFDKEKIANCKRAIKNSIATSARIRSDLEKSSISTVQEYMTTRAQLLEEKNRLLEEQVDLERTCNDLQAALSEAEINVNKLRLQLEQEIKQASIKDISARAILMLERLQQTLYRKQIQRVEDNFRKVIPILMRKSDFIDDIMIDDDFTTHVYRMQSMPIKEVVDMLSGNTEQTLVALIGKLAVQKLKSISNGMNISSMLTYFKDRQNDMLCLPIELDKSVFSNGEKQIFIMALYFSLIQLCSTEVPFIIDTPFARIDTEHRRNISKHFFSKLTGQVFILSTNEEIDSDHVRLLDQKILATYMLENTDNKRTVVYRNKYFEGCV